MNHALKRFQTELERRKMDAIITMGPSMAKYNEIGHGMQKLTFVRSAVSDKGRIKRDAWIEFMVSRRLSRGVSRGLSPLALPLPIT